MSRTSSAAIKMRSGVGEALPWVLLPLVLGIPVPYLAFTGLLYGDRLAARDYLLEMPLLAILASWPTALLSVVLVVLLLLGPLRWRPLIPWLAPGGAAGYLVFQAVFWGPFIMRRFNSTAFIGFTPFTVLPAPALFLMALGLIVSWWVRALTTAISLRSESSKPRAGGA